MLKPLKNFIILRRIENDNKTTSGIILSVNSKQSNSAIVEEIGPDCNDRLKKEMNVIFKESNVTKYFENDVEYLILEEKDILAIVE